MATKCLIDIDSLISTPHFFDFLSNLDVDNALDRRDAKPFDSEWMKEFRNLDSFIISETDKKFIDQLREKSFRISFRISGNSEIAGRVSDDIELVAKSMLAGKMSSWTIASLWNAYLTKTFPS